MAILKVKDGSQWADIPAITGEDGVTFTPSVSAEGVISWTNDGGRTNPQPVNIKGPKGDPGDVSSVNGISPDGSGNVTIPNATQSAAGMMSATDKTKLDGLPASAAVPGSIAIIVDGDTAGTAVAPGQYAYVKNNTHGLAEGLYKNKSSSAFPVSGGTANGTVFEAVSGGGINALSDQIAMYQAFYTYGATDSYGLITVTLPQEYYGYRIVSAAPSTNGYIVIPAYPKPDTDETQWYVKAFTWDMNIPPEGTTVGFYVLLSRYKGNNLI